MTSDSSVAARIHSCIASRVASKLGELEREIVAVCEAERLRRIGVRGPRPLTLCGGHHGSKAVQL